MNKAISYLLICVYICCGQAISQGTTALSSKDRSMFATNEFIAKGGIGVITGGELYIDLKSTKNELRLGGGDRWTGKSASTPEVVIFFESKVYSPQATPNGFDLSRAVVISFENNKVRFFNFGTMRGGFYRRAE